MVSPTQGFGLAKSDAPLMTGSVGSSELLNSPLTAFASVAKPEGGLGLGERRPGGDLPRSSDGTSSDAVDNFLFRLARVDMMMIADVQCTKLVYVQEIPKIGAPAT